LEAEFAGRVRFFHLVRRPRGHGQSYSINYGVAQARGDYVGFLDDDDTWTDPGHLARAQAAIAAAPAPLDLYFANQTAFLKDQPRPGPIWIEDLEGILVAQGARPDAAGAYAVDVPTLLRSHGFCHLNTFIVRRALFQEIGGMDENIRWECDRDFYLRAIDLARVMRHAPPVVARHNVPDPAKTSNMTTALPMIEKRLLQVRVLDKAALFARHPLIRAHGRHYKGVTRKKIAEKLAAAGRVGDAALYAREALAIGYTMKWLGFTLWLHARRLLGTT